MQRGFTLMEAIVSIAVLAFAVAGPMTLAARTLSATGDSRSELIATHLAEEGIEIVRSVRDNNSADGTSWDNWITGNGNCESSSGCIVDIADLGSGGGSQVWGNKVLDKCNGVCDGKMYYNPNTGLYRQVKGSLGSPWVLTNFNRTIYISTIGTRQFHATSTVRYVGYRGKTKSVSINDDLYNWFPAL